ncbi:MAG TPA: thioredoxin family protein [Desulfovibrio sp.]|uniref:thioredoxin family protein n=1 Tax=Desulfovibrio sp. TaxID=885 RepID=UPI002D6A94BE|nr:thioredoxin family protein [Desulfovibrio sp.]HZF60450.1 thioredoxin family protein [Desulfovibrio sp.]
MEIKVFGPGCARCVEAENVVRQAAEQAGGEISVIKVSDFREIMAARIISTPAVMVNGQIKCTGRVPTGSEVANWIAEASA